MLFKASITIPANTTKENATEETLELSHGIITKFMVRPRPGHAAVAHLVIVFRNFQIAPSREGEDFSGDTFPIDWEEYFEFYEAPYELRLLGWNDSTKYSHTFDVFVAVLPRKAIIALAIVDAIKSAFGMLSPRRIFTGGG